MKKKIVCIIEARMTSSRLPGKVLMESCGKPLLQHMIERIERSKLIDEIVVATTVNETDNPIVEMCESIGCSYFRGSEDDVLLRVLEAAQTFGADVIVETTGDCPCIDHRHIDRLTDIYLNGEYDFASNVSPRSYPDGFDIRIFSTKSLEYVNDVSDDVLDHEHVAIYFPNHPEVFKIYSDIAEGVENRTDLEITLDELGDYRLINAIFEALYSDNVDFECRDVIEFLDEHKELLEYTSDISRTVI